jgi:cell division protein FtsZ
MQGEIRVTVIATGFDRHVEGGLVGGSSKVTQPAAMATRNVIPLTQRNPGRAASSSVPRTVVPLADGASKRVIPASAPKRQETELTDMDIPTFIRRQMD